VRPAALGGLVVVLVACSHGDAPPPAAPRGPTACERAADSMVGAMLARLPAEGAPTEQADALRRLIRVRCEQDGWSAEVTRCLIAMRTLADAEPCAKLMPDDQQDALARDLEARSGARPAGQPAGASDGATAPRSGPSGTSGGSGGSGQPGGGP
jgi:hypothetical protein